MSSVVTVTCHGPTTATRYISSGRSAQKTPSLTYLILLRVSLRVAMAHFLFSCFFSSIFISLHFPSPLRHCITSRKGVGFIPDETDLTLPAELWSRVRLILLEK
jgi:hypothetical protein